MKLYGYSALSGSTLSRNFLCYLLTTSLEVRVVPQMPRSNALASMSRILYDFHHKQSTTTSEKATAARSCPRRWLGFRQCRILVYFWSFLRGAKITAHLWGRLLDETVPLEVQDARHAHAAGVVVGAHLPPLLEPPPQNVPPLKGRIRDSDGRERLCHRRLASRQMQTVLVAGT